MSLASQISALATRVATEFNTLRDEIATSVGAALARVRPDEVPGTQEGDLWYDTDDDQFTVDVSYVQPDEPTGAAEGSLWLDTDDPEGHTDSDHADAFAVIDHTHPAVDLSGYATEAELSNHTHDRIVGVDGRGTVQAPSAFVTATRQSRFAPRFHTGAELGLPKAYYAVETITPWSDDSGGGVHQVARGYGETWERYGLRSGAWGPWRVPGGGWQLIDAVVPSGSTSTVGNLSFLNIPSVYKRLRVRSSYLGAGATNSSGHLYVRFNSLSPSSYNNWMAYHTSGSWSGTTSASQAQGYAAYNYFYSTNGSNNYNTLNLEIACAGIGDIQWKSEHEVNYTSYPYGSQVHGELDNYSVSVTRIDLWASFNYAWDPNSLVTLEGALDI